MGDDPLSTLSMPSFVGITAPPKSIVTILRPTDIIFAQGDEPEPPSASKESDLLGPTACAGLNIICIIIPNMLDHENPESCTTKERNKNQIGVAHVTSLV